MNILAPSPGESITEVTISKWFINNGDAVKKNDKIGEIETEKATLEITAEVSGTLNILKSENETVAVGDTIAVIEESEIPKAAGKVPKATDAPPKPIQPKSPSGEKVPLLAPEPGESIKTVSISQWNKQNGEFVRKNEEVASIESEKATLDVTATVSGILTILVKTGETIPTKTEIGYITPQEESTDGAQIKDTAKTIDKQEPATAAVKKYPSPAADKLMTEKNISVDQVVGTGKDGRITKSDVLNLPETPVPPKSPSIETTPVESTGREQKRIKMTQFRKKISERLVSVKNDTAMLTTFNEVDMSAVMEVRSKYKDLFKDKHEIGLGFMSFFTKACTTALMEFPSVNGMIADDEIITHNYADVAIAVSAPKGLMVPVIRNAEQLSLADIEKSIAGLAGKARNNKLTISEMTGGTFTITNGGVFGSMLSTPIINPPQSAILGMHNIVKRPIVVDDRVIIRPIMYVALSYDHRIVDGRESVGFLVRVKQLLEDPVRMLLKV